MLVLLAGAALALTQAILRPLRQAAELAESAGQAAAMGAESSHWPFGMTLENVGAAMCEPHG